LKIFFFFALSAWLAIDFLNAFVPTRLTYLYALCSGIMAMIPLMPSFIVFLPATAHLCIVGCPVIAVLHLALQCGLWFYIPTVMYKKISIEGLVPPYFTGLSVFAGLWVFGWSGVVYGPVVINLVPVIYRQLKYRLLQDNNNGVNHTTIPA
jgi:predicted PurR-regulated permease PerM